jgi:hypothetical protein
MTHEYDDAVTEQKLETAARLVHRRWSADRAVPMHDVAARVVRETFCFCVTDGENAVEGKFSRIHAALIEEVVQRVPMIVTAAPSTEIPANVVDLASDQSFPASDPPAWIWRRRPPRDGGDAA